MMRLLCGLYVVYVHLVLLNSTKHFVKEVYKPCGPIMCRQVCQESNVSFIYDVENLSCHRHPADDSNKRTAGSSAVLRTDLECKNGTNGTTSSAAQTGVEICAKNFTGDSSPFLMDNCTTSETVDNGNINSTQNTPNTTLHQACEKGNLCIVQNILSNGPADINSRGPKGKTPVMIAAMKGHVGVFDFLVRKGCDLSIVDDGKDNVLHLACVSGNTCIVWKLIVRMKYDMESRGYNGWTPVLNAIYYGQRDVVNLLVSNGCNMTAVADNRNNILHIACMGGHVDMVEYILSMQIVDINSKGIYSGTPVMMAARYGHVGVVKCLVNKGCNLKTVDGNRNTILHIACTSGDVDMVEYILSMQIVDINSQGSYIWTPVMLAARYGHVGVAKVLVNKGCNLKTVDEDRNNILHIACIGGHVDMVEFILSMQIVDINSKGSYSRTSVLMAARLDYIGVVKSLVSKGCDLKSVDQHQNSLLHTACLRGHTDLVKYILSAQLVDIDCRGQKGRTTVMMAAWLGQLEVVKFIVGRGCNLRAVDQNKNTLLHIACIGGYLDVIRYILSKQAVDIDSRGQLGMSPVMTAAVCGHIEIVKLLVSKGCNLKTVDTKKNNLLTLACTAGHEDVVNYILSLQILGMRDRGAYRRCKK